MRYSPRAGGLERSPGLARLARESVGCEILEADYTLFDFSPFRVDGILLAGAFVHVPHGEDEVRLRGNCQRGKAGIILIPDRLFVEDHMSENFVKEEAHKLVDKMPENSTWDDLIHEIYVRQVVERGLADSKAGRTKDVGTVRRKFGLPE